MGDTEESEGVSRETGLSDAGGWALTMFFFSGATSAPIEHRERRKGGREFTHVTVFRLLASPVWGYIAIL